MTGGIPVPCFGPGSGDVPYIASFWADSITACADSHVYYRRSHDGPLMNSLSIKINTNIGANGFTFTAREAIIVTWHNVTPSGSNICTPATVREF